MNMKFLLFLIMIFTLGVSGCMQRSNEVVLPDHQLLGRQFSTFQAPAKPVETLQEPQIDEPNGVIGLSKALALALMHNPELKAFSWDVRVFQARQLQESLMPNPELEVEVEGVGGTGENSGFDSAETTFSLSQQIELAGKRHKRTKVARLGKELAEFDYEAKRLDVFTEVSKAFTGVLAGQQRLKLTEELLQLSEEMVNTVARRVEAGKDSPLERTKAQIERWQVKTQHRQALGNLEFARRQLASTWASKEPKFESVAGQLDSLSPLPSIDELTTLVARNPDVARWSLEVEKSKASLELEKAKAVSDIKIGAGVQNSNETDENAVVFGISIGLPVYNRNQGGKLQAAYMLSRAGEEKAAAQSRIQMDLARAYQQLCNSYAEAKELEENVLQTAENVFQASRVGYQQGKLGYLNVLDAQRTYFQVKAQYIDALASFHIAKSDVERLITRPIKGINVSKNEDSI